jgi:histidyl-tRNA synthetase
MRSIDKLDKFDEQNVHLLLTKGRRDESGDFTKGAGLNDEQAGNVLSKLRRYEGNNTEVLDMIRGSASASTRRQQGVDELEQISHLVAAAGYDADRIRIDPSVVRGLEYYTGPVYEAELTFAINDDKGRPVRFGSVGGGGRYDGLVGRFRPEQVPATGFSIGVSRLQAALTALGKLGASKERGPVVVTVFDKDRIGDYQRMVQRLRGANIRAELYLGNPKNFGNQLKYADKRNSPCVIIQGGDEKARGEVQIKDLIEGAKAAQKIATHEEYREARPAQFAVPEDKLVEAVRTVLQRHGLG